MADYGNSNEESRAQLENAFKNSENRMNPWQRLKSAVAGNSQDSLAEAVNRRKAKLNPSEDQE